MLLGLHGRDGGAGRQPRPDRRHVRPRADVQPRLRGLHGLLDPAVGHLDARAAGGALADRDAGRPGHRRRVAVRQLVGDPDRRLPRRPARPGARDQHGRRDRRLVHRPRARRRARAGLVAAGVPRLGARSACSGPSGPTYARGARDPHAGEDRLVGQHHLRRRPDPVLVGITYGILPYGGHTMGWTAPGVIAALGGGLVLLALFV